VEKGLTLREMKAITNFSVLILERSLHFFLSLGLRDNFLVGISHALRF